jgi:hypothetical protein
MISNAMTAPRGFEGVMLGATLQDLIQMECLTLATRSVKVETHDKMGVIYFAGGQVVHAQVGSVQGEEAFYEMLQWRDGNFTIQDGVRPTEETITRHWQGLLLESASRNDESTVTGAPDLQVGGEVIQLDKAQFMQRDPVLEVLADPEVIAGVQFSEDGSLLEAKSDDAENMQAAFAFNIELLRLIGQSLGAENLREVDLHGRQNKGICVLNEKSVACFVTTPKANFTQITKKLV